MNNLIEHRDTGNDQQINVGEGSSQVSIKVYQDVYHQITGRTEQIRRRYRDNLLINFSEIEQLHIKIMQLCDIHHIVAKNETVSIFHSRDRKEQFTSFERFKSYNANATSPTVNVVLKYNFSIIPAALNRPQEYVVTIRLSSRVAMLNELAEDAPPFMRGRFIGYIAGDVAEVSVEYADYIVARGFLEAFDEWIKGCKTTSNKKWIIRAQRWSYLIPKAIKFIIAITTIYFSLRAASILFMEPVDANIAARFFILFGGGFYLLVSIAAVAGTLAEDAIDSYTSISYLRLNSGDNKLIDEFGNRKRFVIGKFISGCLLTVALGVASSRIASLI